MPRLPAGNGKSSVTTSRNSIRPVREIAACDPALARRAETSGLRDIIAGGTGCVRRGLKFRRAFRLGPLRGHSLAGSLACLPPAAHGVRCGTRVRRQLQFARFDGESVQTRPAAAVRTRRGSHAAELASRAASPMAARLRRMAHELGDLFHPFRHGAGIEHGGGFPCHPGGVLRTAGRSAALRLGDRMGHSRFQGGPKVGTEHGAAAQRERRIIAAWRRIGTQPRRRTCSDVSKCRCVEMPMDRDAAASREGRT